MSLNTSGRCSNCDGVVHNIPSKRYSKERLTEIHNVSCPGVVRKKTAS